MQLATVIRRTLSAAGLAAALAAAGAAPAGADSIAYVKGGDVWLSTSDGARQYRVTATGRYSDVTQADDGTLVALAGVRLHRLDRAGTVLADFDTPVSDTRPEGQRVFYGPLDPALSPDGRKLAYTYYFVGKGSQPGCLPPTCMTTVTEGGTGYSHADRQTAWDEPGLGRHSGWRNATWLDDATTMISDPTHLPNADVLLDTVGDAGVPIKDWFSDGGTPHLGAGEMTRQRTKLAFQAGQGDTGIRIYRMNGDYPALPRACYAYEATVGATVGAPSWAPDGRRLAWAEADGIRVVDVPDLAAGCTTEGASPASRVLVPGAGQPDWGPVDVPAGSGAQPGTGNGPGGGTGSAPGRPSIPGGPGAPGASGAPGLPGAPGAAKPRLGLASAALSRRSLRLQVTVPEAGRLSATVRAGRVRVGSLRPRRLGRAGRHTVTVRLSAAGRRALRRARRARITVALEHSGANRTHRTTTTTTIKGGSR